MRQLFIKSILIYLRNNFGSFNKQFVVRDGNEVGQNTRSSTMQNLVIPMRRTLLGQQSKDFIGPHIFNQLLLLLKYID